MAILTSETMQPADNLLVVSMEALQSKEDEATAAPGLRRNHSNLTLVSLSSEFSAASDSTSTSQSTAEASRRRRTRKKQKNGPPVDLVAKAVADMTISEEEKSQYVALDCEMVGAGYNGKHSILARVTIVDWDHNVILDEFVKPHRPVTDYRTFVSGITPELLGQANLLDIEEARRKVLEILQGKIMVGHGLKNDMRALGIAQLPWYAVRDTAKYEPLLKARFEDGVLWPQSLKTLAKNRLRRDIQIVGQAHCPLEDAATAMDLYKINRKKWEMAVEYKHNKTREIVQGQQA